MSAPDTPPMTPIVRTARSVRSDVPRIGAAARSASTLVARLGVAPSRLPGREDRIALPWGVWPRAVEEADSALAGLDPALASYAARLRRKKASRRARAERGIPLVVRRAGGTRWGPNRGPGGLARSLQPEDQPVTPPEGVSPAAPRPAPAPAASAARRSGGR